MNLRQTSFSVLYLIVLLLLGKQSFAQEDTVMINTDPFYVELSAIKGAFEDTTNSDTMTILLTDLTDQGDLTGYEMLNSTEVLDLIDSYELMTDNGDNNIIYEQYGEFTYDAEEYDKAFSYSIQRKMLGTINIGSTVLTNHYCIHIYEKLTIDKEEFPTTLDIDNNYYVIYDDEDNLVAISAFNEIVSDRLVYRQKYLELESSGAKSGITKSKHINIVNEYLKVSPNPAKNEVKFDIRLNKADKGTIRITDITGKIVAEMETYNIAKHVNYSLSYNVSAFSSGMYFVSLVTEHTNKNTKLIISK